MSDLLMKRENGWKKSSASKEEVFAFCEGYKKYLNSARTEREFTSLTIETAKAKGFKDISEFKTLKPGDKVYRNNRGKGVLLAVIGEEDIECGINIIGSHIDSPRLDLKPNPLYEDSELALFKTHYYGGIKKYQWTSIPLAMHGTVVLNDNSTINISIGDESEDVTFTITDLLPHLADEQAKKELYKAIEGESLNILLGSIPAEGAEKDAVKTAVMQLLNDKYGICEEDFVSAEIEFVPAYDLKDTGLDRSFVVGPAQDDRVCAYTSLEAIFEIQKPSKTAVCILVDKEEVGSMGVTGFRSKFFEDTIAEIAYLMSDNYSDLTVRRCFASSTCLSADVCAMHDPNYPSVLEKNNAAYAGGGITIVKYTGSRGKGGASDASAELMGKIRNIFNANNVLWQVAELGRIDLGGGGTISQYVANLNIDTVDCGVALFSMHSPYEIASKLDIYMTYKAYKAFYEN